jgi:hypothetical protein
MKTPVSISACIIITPFVILFYVLYQMIQAISSQCMLEQTKHNIECENQRSIMK